MSKKLLARLVEMFCLERGIALYAYGNMTLDDERAEYAVEPDECYCRGEDRAMPDLAIEVVVTRGAIDKLELYHHMGVREVWLFEAGSLQILSRRDVGYEGVSVTAILPELDLARLVHYATQPDQNAALVEFVAELRAKS
jgi:Uma2 family endonuclease